MTDDWNRAVDLWLKSRRSENTRRSYRRALEDLLANYGRGDPGRINREAILSWADSLRRRPMSEATVQQYLAAAASFYRFAVDDLGLEMIMPVTRSARGRISPFGKATWLDAGQSRQILQAIDRGTATGKRNYALILGYMMLGRRNSEWRRACWGDFKVHGKKVFYKWSGKGHEDQQEVPPPVWEAVLDWLQASGRIGKIQIQEPVFTAMDGSARYFPNQRGWIPGNSPISAREAGRILKRACRRAGIDEQIICIHSLRHTAAMLRKQSGDDIEEICGFLTHSSVSVTQIYLHTMEGKTDRSWVKVGRLLGLEGNVI